MLVATFSGWMLDGMDVMIYTFVLPSLVAQWRLTPPQAGWLATSALLLSSLGGWLAGIAADRYGRVRLLQITILWFAVFTFLSGFALNFWQLLVVRGLQGLGFGGEWTVGSVLMSETIRARFRGRAVGTVQAGWAVGWAIALGFYLLFFTLLPAPLAWRALFWVGLLPAFLVFYVRHRVEEPPSFHPSKLPPTALFRSGLLRTTFPCLLLSLGAQGGYYALNTWLPFYLRTDRGLSVLNTASYLSVLILGAFTGYLVSAHLADYLGRRTTLLLFAFCSAAAVLLYTSIRLDAAAFALLGFPLGFCMSGVFSPMGSFFAELFPTDLRASGSGFAYNFGRAFGAFFPSGVGYIGMHLPLASAIALFAASAYLLMGTAVLLLPETRARGLYPGSL